MTKPCQKNKIYWRNSILPIKFISNWLLTVISSVVENKILPENRDFVLNHVFSTETSDFMFKSFFFLLKNAEIYNLAISPPPGGKGFLSR